MQLSFVRVHLPGLVSLAIAGLLVLGFSTRFAIVFPQQPAEIECLHARAFLIDRQDRDIQPGDLVAFRLHADTAVFKKGAGLIKLVAATEGQRYSITERGVVAEDFSVEVDSSRVIKRLNLSGEDVYRTGVVESGRFFAVGERASSFDSRYWGTATMSGIEGRAYALF